MSAYEFDCQPPCRGTVERKPEAVFVRLEDASTRARRRLPGTRPVCLVAPERVRRPAARPPYLCSITVQDTRRRHRVRLDVGTVSGIPRAGDFASIPLVQVRHPTAGPHGDRDLADHGRGPGTPVARAGIESSRRAPRCRPGGAGSQSRAVTAGRGRNEVHPVAVQPGASEESRIAHPRRCRAQANPQGPAPGAVRARRHQSGSGTAILPGGTRARHRERAGPAGSDIGRGSPRSSFGRRRCSSFRRSTKGLACPYSRRWPRARAWSRGTSRPWPRCSETQASGSKRAMTCCWLRPWVSCWTIRRNALSMGVPRRYGRVSSAPKRWRAARSRCTPRLLSEVERGVSVVICCHNSASLLPATLDHFARQRGRSVDQLGGNRGRQPVDRQHGVGCAPLVDCRTGAQGDLPFGRPLLKARRPIVEPRP